MVKAGKLPWADAANGLRASRNEAAASTGRASALNILRSRVGLLPADMKCATLCATTFDFFADRALSVRSGDIINDDLKLQLILIDIASGIWLWRIRQGRSQHLE